MFVLHIHVNKNSMFKVVKSK